MPAPRLALGKSYHFRVSSMIWLTVPASAILVLLWMFADRYLLGTRPAAIWNPPACDGRSCVPIILRYFIIMAFPLIPLWIKVPAVIGGAGEALARLIAPLVWTFDKRPDFTIGPDGIYGPSGLTFERVLWAEVSNATRRVYLTNFGPFFGLDIETTRNARSFGLFSLGRNKPVILRLRPIHGFPLQEIVDQIRLFAPDLMIFTEETDHRWRGRFRG